MPKKKKKDFKIDDFRIISVSQLVRAIKDGESNSERFCFILGSGASVTSDIPSGTALEDTWMTDMEIEPGFDEIEKLADTLYKNNRIKHNFKIIKESWEKANKESRPMPSDYYSDIYNLRFFPNHRNGYHYLEREMADAKPSYGYIPLARMLTDEKGNNLVITTNFDSLVEDALFLFTDKKPLVINHELLADFAGDPNITRPIIAKIHRGLFFNPFNKPDEIKELKGKWREVLTHIFKIYTPIVIGYGGGDNSLMELLKDESITMRNGIYWCYMNKYGLPSSEIQKLVSDKKGFLVTTDGFDSTMLAIGNEQFPEKINIQEIENYLTTQANSRIADYQDEYKKLIQQKDAESSTSETKKEIEKIENRVNKLDDERKTSNTITKWDYIRLGNNASDSQKYEDAIDLYTKAIQLDNNFYQAYNNRGVAYYELSEYPKAIDDYNMALEINPNFAEVYNNRGNAYNELSEYPKAIDDYNMALEINPNYAEAYNNRGVVFYDLTEHQKAIDDFNMAIKINPNYAEAYNNRGVAFYDLTEYQKAIDDYNIAIEINPNYAEAYYNRGVAFYDLTEYQKAIDDYNMAIEINPNDSEAYNNRGNAYNKLSEHQKAIDDFTMAIEINPNYTKAYINRERAYRETNQNEKADKDKEMIEKLLNNTTD